LEKARLIQKCSKHHPIGALTKELDLSPKPFRQLRKVHHFTTVFWSTQEIPDIWLKKKDYQGIPRPIVEQFLSFVKPHAK
jgi:hypothetical protein